METKVLYILSFYSRLLSIGDLDLLNDFYFILSHILSRDELRDFNSKYRSLVYKPELLQNRSDLVHVIFGDELIEDYKFRKNKAYEVQRRRSPRHLKI